MSAKIEERVEEIVQDLLADVPELELDGGICIPMEQVSQIRLHIDF